MGAKDQPGQERFRRVNKVLRRLKIINVVLMLGASCALILSCGTDHSKVRFVHASPDASGLDVAVDGKTVATNLNFGGLSPASDYLSLTAGNHRVEFRSTGTTDDLINATAGFASQTEYTLLAVELSPAPPPNTPPSSAALLKTDDNSPPQSGNIKVRVIHSAPDPVDLQQNEPAHVDVYIVPARHEISPMQLQPLPALATNRRATIRMWRLRLTK